MRKVTPVLILSLLFVSVSCNFNNSNDLSDRNSTKDSSNIITDKFKLEGMTCIGCENTVNYAVRLIPGVEKTSSSFQKEYLIVTYDSTIVDIIDIENAVNERGYKFIGRYRNEDITYPFE